MESFRGRVAVITGAAGGIGGALARELAARGARLVLADLDGEGAVELAAELEKDGTEALAQATDVRSLPSLRALSEAAEARFGGVDLLFNNAGVVTLGEICSLPDSDWDFTMGVNFQGVLNGVRVFVPRMIERAQGGHVVNTASMAGLMGMQWLGAYSASKFAVVGLSEALSRELSRHGIAVSVLCPMMVRTQMAERSRWARDGGPIASAQDGATLPEDAFPGRLITPEEVAQRTLRGVQRGDFYILTHAEQRELLKRRAERLDAVFASESWELAP